MTGKFEQKNSYAAKLTAGQVLEIREAYAQGSTTQGALSRYFGVSVITIGRIVRGEVWQKLGPRHATQEEIAASAQRMLTMQEAIGQDRLAAEARRLLVGVGMVEELLAVPARPNPLDE